LAEGSQVEPQALFVLRPNRDLLMKLEPVEGLPAQ
jgi:hypothetical protein